MAEIPPLIQTPQALTDLCEALAHAEFVAVDTEFVRESTYYPGLCLVQLATDDLLALVDARSDIDMRILFNALSRPDLVKVLHAARQDLEIFFMIAGAVPPPIFDSQIAAGCLGYGEQLSYSALANALLGVEPGKSHARTDWTRRPLTEEQLRYAADDVIHLVQIYHRLGEELQARNRQHWLKETFDNLVDPQLYEPQPETAYKRIRGGRRLSALQQSRLRQLAAWRERLAMDMNRPRRWIVGDETLIALAASDVNQQNLLEGIPGLPAKLKNRQGDALIKLLRDADSTDNSNALLPARRSTAENRLLKKFVTAVKEEAGRQKTSPGLLATRADLEELLRSDDPQQAVLNGWRRELIGEKLLQIKAASMPTDIQ